MTPFLQIRERRAGDEVVLALSGELDRESSEELVGRLSRLAHAGASVVLELRGLGFIDPSGVETLRRAAAWAAADGWTLAITGTPPAVHRVLRLAGAEGVLPLRGA